MTPTINSKSSNNIAKAGMPQNIQSNCLYIQAAGSEGKESTLGNHLRWILKGPLEKHLPKGDHFQHAPEGFNKPDDFVTIQRAIYNPVVTSFDFTKVDPQTIIDNEALWLYEVNGRMFYVYFRNKNKYQQIRNSMNPQGNVFSFINQYGSNIIEVECRDMLFFAATIHSTSREKAGGNIKTEVLSVEANKTNLPKNVTFRKNITKFPQKIFAENGRSIRFAAFGCQITGLEFEFYDDFLNSVQWKEIGKYALSTNDDDIRERLQPDRIHAQWARYNDGEYVNVDNYLTKWNGDIKETRNLIKNSVEMYLKFSDDPANPLANENYYLNDDASDPDNAPLEISHLTVLQMASLDYHVARMLGLGVLDTGSEAEHGIQCVYLAQYTTIADLNDGQGVTEVQHLSMTLPTSIYDSRSVLPIDLKKPVPGIISSEPTASTAPSLTDPDGYTHDGTARYLSLMIEEVKPDEPADSPFYFTSHEFSMAEFTYPVYVGIEYKRKGDEWRIPELPSDPMYQNVRDDQSLSKNETVPISLPDFGHPAYVHKEMRSGQHIYGSYGVNWFSRATSSDKTWMVESEIKPSNSLLPPSSINAFLIQKELPLLLTSQNEQDQLALMPTNSDKTLVRLTFEYDSNQDMKTYQKEVNGVPVPDFNPLPDNEELFADNVEVFFRPEMPKQVFGMVETVSDLPGNPLVSVITTKDLPIVSGSQTVSPNIPSPQFPNYVGGIFKIGADDYIIHNIVTGATANHPTFHVLKKQISTAFGQNLTIPFDPANFTTPLAGESFMVVENMQNPSTWGNSNPHPLKVKIGNAWPIHTEEVTIRSGQAPDITENTYFRKFRGILKNATVKKFTDQLNPQFAGMYEITFPGYTLNNHPQFSSTPGSDSVQWYRGSIRVPRESDSGGERKVLKVVRIDNINSGDLVVYALDESYSTDPLQSQNTRPASVNFYPGYRVYLYKNIPCRLTENDIIPQEDGVLEKYSIFGLRSSDLQYNDYKSRISIPSIMFAKKIEAPQMPQKPKGSKYSTRPDYYGRSSYAFTTVYEHKPFSVTFLRSNDNILLNALYKQTPYGEPIQDNTVQHIRLKNNDAFFNDRLLALADIIVDSDRTRFKASNGYGFPLPNNNDLFKGINKFIDEHNTFFEESLPHKSFSDIANMDSVIIPLHASGKHGEVKFIDFIKQTIENAYFPLTEIPIIYQHINPSSYQPVPKAQVIRDRNGVLLNPTSPDFDMAPMMKITGTAPHSTLFVDYTLDGASNNVYFYKVKETNAQMVQSDLSPAIGPVRMVNSFPLRTPEIKTVLPVLENPVSGERPKILVNINSYDKIHNVKKVKLYRALNIADSLSIRDMKLVKEINLEQTGMIQDSEWTVGDDFSDLNQVPFNDPLYYKVTVEREIQYAEPNYTGQPDVIVTDYAPSEASKLMITTITENVIPKSPVLTFTSSETPTQIIEVEFSWPATAYKGKYHLYKMGSQGTWTKLMTVQDNASSFQLPLSWTSWGSDILPAIDSNNEPIFHHFKVVAENTSGMLSQEENILTIGNPLAFSIESNPLLARYKPYFNTDSLTNSKNIYISPCYAYGAIYNTPTNGIVPDSETFRLWKSMSDSYIVLPEILPDRKKNPHVYNINTKKFACYYTITRMWDGTIQGSQGNFLRESVKRARQTGARECIVNLGNNAVFIKKNIDKLKFAIASKNDRGMDRITLITNGIATHYTLKQISEL
ncbi:hypothetical protein ACFONJ_02340 [Chryseobacterium tructae]|uniref:Uncharacterized protein n=1 Tax=Chryseobacterium tructae TaxID=1037380 RepID=A0ABV7XST7_9FLAO